jgi:hypothetical protein
VDSEKDKDRYLIYQPCDGRASNENFSAHLTIELENQSQKFDSKFTD